MKLYEPIDTLKRVEQGIFVVDGPIVKMAYGPFALPFPTRMVIVVLPGGDLWIWSPTALSERLRAQVDALGPVRHLVSPNKIHYANIQSWKDAYPEALAWASPGVRERAHEQKIHVVFDRDLGDDAPPQWRDTIDQVVFRGSRFMDEVVFFHRPSRTLLVADMLENFERAKVAPGFRWLLALGGVTDPDGKTPADLRATFFGRRNLARACYERILALAPERVVIAHGRWYERDGLGELRRAFRWLA